MDRLTGNRCGHDPLSPRFFVSKSKRPDTIKLAQKALASFYFAPDRYLPRLQYLNSPTHKQKSERREGIATAAQVLLEYMDLSTLQVGTLVGNGDMIAMQAAFLSQKTGWGMKRCYRALKDLARAGYISLRYKPYKAFGRLMATRFIKVFPKLFHDLGISNARLETSRHYKRNSVITGGSKGGKDYTTRTERVQCEANKSRLQGMLKNAVGKTEAPKKAVQAQPLPTPTPISKKGLPRLSDMVKKLNSTTSREERENHQDRRLAYFRSLRDEGVEFDQAKAKADEKFPPLV